MLKKYILLLLVLTVGCQESKNCLSRDYGNGGTVCVCNSAHCDTIPRAQRVEPPQYLVYTSNQDGLRFSKSTNRFQNVRKPQNPIRINRHQRYQTIEGWGGAFTDSTGINIDSLQQNLQDALLRSYFSRDGIEYSTCRVPIGGTDFSTHGYSYDDGDVDVELKNFALALEDYIYKIRYIKAAAHLSNNDLRLFASAWAAPIWMKTNDAYAGVGFIIPEMYQVWANYFVKFLDAYQEEGVKFWGITTGNEPNSIYLEGEQIPIVGWEATDLGSWILNNLGPTIKASKHSHIKILFLDDQREYLTTFLDEALADEETIAYIDGIAVHWYTDTIYPASWLTDTHNNFSDKFLISTEACNGFLANDTHILLGSWARGVLYAVDIIQDLQNWVTGWVDWNMVLNTEGGPTYISNFVDSPIIVNSTAGEFYKQPMYYCLGHFSKFAPRGSVVLGTSSDGLDNVSYVVFERPDGGTAVVLLNQNANESTVSLIDGSRGTAVLRLSGNSISTVLYW